MTTDKPKPGAIAARLRRQGFDKTYCSNGYVKPSCSQCEVLVINGTPCHENGCPNTKR